MARLAQIAINETDMAIRDLVHLLTQIPSPIRGLWVGQWGSAVEAQLLSYHMSGLVLAL